MLNFYLSLTNRNMATRRNVPNKGIDGGRILVPYANGSRFFAPLTDSVVPNRSIWPITFSRATAATVQDNEGMIRYCLSGEARFQGARRVENLFSYSEDASNVYWNKVRASVTANAIAWPDGRLVADLVVGTVAGGSYIYAPMNVIAGNKYRVSVCVKAADVTNFNIISLTQPWSCAFYPTLGTAWTPSGIASLPTMTNLWNGWYRYSLLLTANATGSNDIGFVSQNYVWNICYVCEMQMEDVTGQSDTSFGGYVSTNVLSSPFHGAMVDGVKYFDTDISGNQLSPDGYLAEWQKTNLFTNSEDFSLWTKSGTWVITPNATIAPDGRMTADLFTLSTANESQGVNQAITTTASIYWDSLYVKPNGHYYIQLLASSGINSGYCNFDLLNGVVGTTSGYTGRVEALPNGWYRIKVTTPTVTAATGNFIITFVPSASASRWSFVSGTGSSGMYIWWASLELGASSSYIPSTLGTRNDDILEYQLRNLESKQWTVYVETTQYFTSNNVALLWLTGGSCRILWSSGTAPWFIRSGTQVIINDGSSNLLSSNSVAASQYDRVLWKYSWSAQEICLNGTLTSGTFDGTTSFTNLYIGNAWVSRSLYGSIRNLQIWDYEISDAEAVALTTI